MIKITDAYRSQKVLLAFAAASPALVAVIVLPILARLLSPELMGAISVILMLGAFFGGFDILRPVFVRSFAQRFINHEIVPVRIELLLTVSLGLVVTAVFFTICVVFFGRYLNLLSAGLLAISGFWFCVSILFWAILDGSGRVGFAQFVRGAFAMVLYLAYLLFARINAEISTYAWFFLFTQLAICFIFYASTKSKLSWVGLGCESPPWGRGQIVDTLKVNASKIFIDFTDRLVLGKILSPHVFAAYSMIYDVASKLNIGPQYINSYFYPKLCAEYSSESRERFVARIRRLVLLGGINFAALIAVAGIVSFWSDELVTLYMGDRYAEFGIFLTYLLLVSAVYSLAFYGQSCTRAVGDFSGLAQSFNISVFFGLFFGVGGYFVFGSTSILLMVLFLKSPGIGLFLKALRGYYSIGICIGFMLFIFASVVVLIYISFESIGIALFGLSVICAIAFLSLILQDRNSKVGNC